MKKRISMAVAFVLVLSLLLPVFSGCMYATSTAAAVFSDASGAGTMTSTVTIPITQANGNAYYVKDAKKLAEALDALADELTGSKGIYSVRYAGKDGDNEKIEMTYSFTDINDYNKKTMRLFNCIPLSVRNKVSSSLGDNYPYASWTCASNGDGTYNATFSQNGYIFTVINMWAYDYMLNYDIEGAWDNTGDNYAALLSVFDKTVGTGVTNTFVTAAFDVTITVGSTTKKVTAVEGSTAKTVSVTGKVSGTPVAVDKTVTDADITVEYPSPSKVRVHKDSVGEYVNETPILQGADLPTGRKIKVACVGDSITHGTDDRGYPSYPRYLQDILGDNYEVKNFGVGGTTLLFSDGVPAAYTKSEMYQPSLEFEPDVVIIMLGTNDGAGAYASKRIDKYYESDYQTLINTYKNLPSHPYVIVATSPYHVVNEPVVNNYVVPLQREIFSRMEGIDGVVDIYAWSEGKYYRYVDNVHYDPTGYYSLALKYAEDIFGISNGYHTVTVKTVPGAVVDLDKQNSGSVQYTHSVEADENGVAVCYAQNGSYKLTVRAENYVYHTENVTVSGDRTVTVSLTPGDYDVAYRCPVTASSQVDETDLPSYVNDGDYATQWHPNENESEKAWLLFDLGAKKEIHGIMIESWFQAYASGYNIEVSDDGTTFKKIATITNGQGEPDDIHFFNSASGRYVRINFTKKGYAFNYEIYDVKLFSNDMPEAAKHPVGGAAAQLSTDGKTIRLIGAVDSLAYDTVGFEVVLNDIDTGRAVTKTYYDTTVYSALTFDGTTVTSADFGIENGYIFVLVVENIPENTSVKATPFTVSDRSYYGVKKRFSVFGGEM